MQWSEVKIGQRFFCPEHRPEIIWRKISDIHRQNIATYESSKIRHIDAEYTVVPGEREVREKLIIDVVKTARRSLEFSSCECWPRHLRDDGNPPSAKPCTKCSLETALRKLNEHEEKSNPESNPKKSSNQEPFQTRT